MVLFCSWLVAFFSMQTVQWPSLYCFLLHLNHFLQVEMTYSAIVIFLILWVIESAKGFFPLLFFPSLMEYTWYRFFGSIVTTFPLILRRALAVTWTKSSTSHLPDSPRAAAPRQLLPSFCPEHGTIWSRTALWLGWHGCPSCVPPQHPVPASLLTQVGWEAKKSLTLVKPCLAQPKHQWVIQSVLILQNTAPHQLLGEELTGSQPKPGQLFNS